MTKFKILLSMFAVSAIFALTAQATCMVVSCKDSDGGNFPRIPGKVTQVTSCSPPGGPATTQEQIDKDTCVRNRHTEYVCEFNQYAHANVSTAKVTLCECNPNGKSCKRNCRGGSCKDDVVAPVEPTAATAVIEAPVQAPVKRK